jgi:hypothetical protein
MAAMAPLADVCINRLSPPPTADIPSSKFQALMGPKKRQRKAGIFHFRDYCNNGSLLTNLA